MSDDPEPLERENAAVLPSPDGEHEVRLTGQHLDDVPECPECDGIGEPLPDAESVTSIACMDETCEVGSYLPDGTVLWREDEPESL